MTLLADVKKAVKDIFDSNDDLNLNKWRTSFSGSDNDKQVDEIDFESNDQVFEEGSSTIVIRPRIKDKKQRTSLINGIEKIVENNIEIVRQKFVSHLDTSESYVIETQKKYFLKVVLLHLELKHINLKLIKKEIHLNQQIQIGKFLFKLRVYQTVQLENVLTPMR